MTRRTYQKCVTCDEELFYRWTDTHGVGACAKCGTPYTIYHYENDVRVERPPVPALKPSGLELAKRYWAEKRMRVFPGCYDFMGVSRRRGGTTYSGATEEEMGTFDEWCKDLKGDDLDDAIDDNGGRFTV